MAAAEWVPRRLAAIAVVLPEGVTPPGTRGRILESALALFAEWGFHGTSIRQIGAGASINSATLYSHFASKEEILRELVLIGHSALYDRLAASITGLTSPADRLEALVRAQVLAHADFPLLAVVTNSELHVLSAEAAGPSMELRIAASQLVLTALEDGKRDGSFDIEDVVLLTRAIAGMGLQVGNWFGPDVPHGRDEVADSYAEYALRMAGAAGAASRRSETVASGTGATLGERTSE
jgi:AcrR family transcriptional regulator